MPDRLGSICAYLDYSIPEIRGEHVRFTAGSGEGEMQVCMSRGEARKMARKTLALLDAEELFDQIGRGGAAIARLHHATALRE